MYFKDKYFKYKKKYLALKKLQQIGSSNHDDGLWQEVLRKGGKGGRGRGGRGREGNGRGGRGRGGRGREGNGRGGRGRGGNGRGGRGRGARNFDELQEVPSEGGRGRGGVKKADVQSYKRDDKSVSEHVREIIVSNRWSYKSDNSSDYDKNSAPTLGVRQVSISQDAIEPYFNFLKRFEDRFKEQSANSKGFDFTRMIYSTLQKEKIYESNDIMFKRRFDKKYKFKIDRINSSDSGIYINLKGMLEGEIDFNDNVKLSLHSSKDLHNRIHIVLENNIKGDRVLIPCQLHYNNMLQLGLFEEDHERRLFNDLYLDNTTFKNSLIILFNKIFEDLQNFSEEYKKIGIFNPNNFTLYSERGGRGRGDRKGGRGSGDRKGGRGSGDMKGW